MAYQTYITEAIVCGVTDSQTSDRSYLLFTREAGMVYAHAKSVREERSKHRYSLQECSYARVTLVRGKSGWRITGAEPLDNFYARTHSREARAFIRNILILIRRFIQGETAHENIFDEVVFACTHVEKYNPRKLELVLSLRMLEKLGYIGENEELRPLIQDSIETVVVDSLSPDREKQCAALITNALSESHL
jgi:DNA repair protein RecO